MGDREAQQHIWRLRERLHREFEAPIVIRFFQVLAEELGGVRLTMPDLEEHYRWERNRRMRNEFNGVNVVELAIKYRLQARQVRRIVRG